MYNFKEFFNKNCTFKMLLEAYRGWHSEKPILYDYEDLDFLYQIDQKYWEDALKARYMKTWELLKNRENIRNKIIKEMIDASKASGFLKVVKTPAKNVMGFKKSTKFNVDENNVNEFKEFLLKISNRYDSYGKEVGSVNEKEASERKRWIDDFFERYDIETITPGGSKDNYKTIRNLIFDIIKRIVIYVKGGDEEKYLAGGSINIKFYINRLIQKLETTEGEAHYLKTKLVNLSKIYKKDMYFEPQGKYGFDLSLPRRKTIITNNEEGKPEKETTYGFDSSGFYFPKSTGIRDSLSRLMSLNYQRHLPNETGSGDLPSDSPEKMHDVTYKIVRSKMGKVKRYKDTFIFDVFQKKFANQIAKFVSNNSDINWYDDKVKEMLEGSLDSEKEMEEINSGVWLVKSILNNPNAGVEKANEISKQLKKIFHGTVYGADKKLYDREVIDYTKKEDNKIGPATLRNITKFENIKKIRKLKDMFSEYFATLRATDTLEKIKLSGPKILSTMETGDAEKDAEIIRKELTLLDSRDKDELKTILGEEDWKKFIKTGRLPYKIDKDTKEILVGGEHPPIVLPHVTVKDENGVHSFPLLNPGSFVMPLKMLTSEELEDIDRTKREIQDNINSYSELNNINLDDDEELESLLNSIEKQPKYKNLDNKDFKQKLNKLIKIIKSQKEAENRKITTSRSSSVLGEKGEATPIIQYHKADRYARERGSIVPGHRPRSAMSMPSSPQEIKTMIGYYKIFSSTQRENQPTTIVNPRGGTLIDGGTWKTINKIFEKNPEKKPDKETVNPMRFYVYDIFNKAERDLEGNKQLESVNLNNFILIKEFKINEAKEAYYEIEKSKDDSGGARDQIEGWDDIVEGMKLFLLRKMYGGNELDSGVKEKYLKPRKFQDIHDEIAAEFVKEASSPTLWSPEARRIAAAGIIGKIAQKETGFRDVKDDDDDDEIKQVARKRRTGQGAEKTEKSSSRLDISPLNSSSSGGKDVLKLIFIDMKNPFIRRAQDGSKVALLRFGWRANPSEAIEQEDSIENHIYKYSKLLESANTLLSGSDKTNKIVFDKIIDNIENEKNNLLSFWDDFYNLALNKFNDSTKDKSTDSYKTILDYFSESDEITRKKVSSLYDSVTQKMLAKEDVIVTSISFDTNESINNIVSTKIEDLKIIFNQINDIIKEDPEVKITSTPFTAKGRGPGVSKDETDDEYKERRRLWFQKIGYIAPIVPVKMNAMEKPIVYWARLVKELFVYLNHHTNKNHIESDIDTRLTIQKFIAIKLGGISRLSRDLKYPVHSFFDRIDKNIKELSEIFNKNKDKLSLSIGEKESIIKTIGMFSGSIPNLKGTLFKSLQK